MIFLKTKNKGTFLSPNPNTRAPNLIYLLKHWWAEQVEPSSIPNKRNRGLQRWVFCLLLLISVCMKRSRNFLSNWSSTSRSARADWIFDYRLHYSIFYFSI